MDYYARAVAPPKPHLHIAMAIVAMAVLVLSGCSNSSSTTEPESPGIDNTTTSMNNTTLNTEPESPGMNNTTNNTEFSAGLNDPSGYIAGLEFLSAEDDAIYQCLLSAATASAANRGLQAYPVTTIELPEHQVYGLGVYANWCKTVGAGDAVDADISSCRYLNGGFNAPGTEVLQLIATRQHNSEIGSKIEQIELKSFKIPEQGSTDFKVEYWRIRGGEQDTNFFSLVFIPFESNTYNRELRVSIGSNYAYIDRDNGLSVYFYPNRAVVEQKSFLASSAIEFRTIVTADYEALKVQVEQELNAVSSLDATAKQAALAKATTEIDRRISVIDQNSEAFHRELVEQFAIEECG